VNYRTEAWDFSGVSGGYSVVYSNTMIKALVDLQVLNLFGQVKLKKISEVFYVSYVFPECWSIVNVTLISLEYQQLFEIRPSNTAFLCSSFASDLRSCARIC